MRALVVLVLLQLQTGTTNAWQDPNATATMRTYHRSCVRPKCGGGSACLPRFSKASSGSVRKGVAWVIGVRRARRISTTDWANMEHFAASSLPPFEALFKSKQGVDYVAVPQVASLKGFRSARGADTDWFEGLTKAMTRALGREAEILGRAELVGAGGCFEKVVYATYVPRATYVKDAAAGAALRAAAASLVGIDERPTLRPVVTVLLRSLGGGAARRAGPGWSNSRRLRQELEAWVSQNKPGWRLNFVALAHAFSFEAQVQLAATTSVLVAAHGASLTNALFLPPGAAVVEVLNCGHRSNTYRLLSTNRGLSYFNAAKTDRYRGDDCSRDLGRKNVDARRPLAMSEISNPLSQAIDSVPLSTTEAMRPCPPLRRAAKISDDRGEVEEDVFRLLDDSITSSSSNEDDDCRAWRVASLVSVHVATLKEGSHGKDPAFHAHRRKFVMANQDKIAAGSSGYSFSAALEAFATALIEAQRVAQHVLFLHISKAAGTSFAKVAKANGCLGPSQFSTMWAPGDGPTWGNCARGSVSAHVSQERIGRGRRKNCAARELTCSQRADAFQKGKYDLMAVERWMDGAGRLCVGTFWYVVLIREPIARVISHHNHIWSRNLRATQRNDKKGRTKSVKGGPYFLGLFQNDSCVSSKDIPYSIGAPHRTGYDWSMTCALSSNFVTRSLLGTSFSPRPYDAEVPPSHSESATLQSAKEILAQFAVVLVVERAQEASKLLRHSLGFKAFNNQVLPRLGRDSSSQRKIINTKRRLHPTDLKLLQRHNRLDLDLYSYANRLFDADITFYDKATVFREPILDGRRLFCDSRNRNRSATLSRDDDWLGRDEPPYEDEENEKARVEEDLLR